MALGSVLTVLPSCPKYSGHHTFTAFPSSIRFVAVTLIFARRSLPTPREATHALYHGTVRFKLSAHGAGNNVLFFQRKDREKKSAGDTFFFASYASLHWKNCHDMKQPWPTRGAGKELPNMKVTCTKLFEDYNSAKAWCLEHKDNYAKLHRTDPKTKALLNSTWEWEVIWYEYQGQRKGGEKTTFDRFDQHSNGGVDLGRAAKRFRDDYETSRGFGLI